MRYVQMPKTGTHHIIRLLRHNFPGQEWEHIHTPAIKGELLFGSIRSPWTWYLSAWACGYTPGVPRGPDTPEGFQAWLEAIEGHPRHRYTAQAEKVYAPDGEWLVDKFVRFERIEQTLAEILGPIETFKTRLNASTRAFPDKEYWNDAAKQRILRWDGKAMERFGYVE